MKKLFYIGIIGITLFEFFKVYFIMPFPGSQAINSLDFAYFLHTYRWFIRIAFLLMLAAGARHAFAVKRMWVPGLFTILALVVGYYFNFKMTADSIFKEPGQLVFKSATDNILGDSSVVVGVSINGQTKAYPVRYIVYHHQVQDEVGGKPVLITYCSVCRTGRVFEPMVKGKPEKFRLVGMDHFNAMFEDATTKSWWRQVNGEAVTGLLKGEVLPEVESFQLTIAKLFELYPDAQVMQPDLAALTGLKYDTLGKYEYGKGKSALTRTDSLSWQEKSWVVGVEVEGASKAYDWNLLKAERVLHDKIRSTALVIALAADEQSFSVFKRADTAQFTLRNDTLFVGSYAYNFSGRALNGGESLLRLNAYQEFWHSWRTFHPDTERFGEK
ncbi:MAG: DUF3179 domain-containing protein [Cyclobacteriaceae bacterium]|nr:DUF3179 domain-containing protein [Cyclobacteriaceae bacterium]